MMKKIKFTPFVVVLLSAFALAFAACEPKTGTEEPAADETGEAVDGAAEEAGDAAK